MATLTSSQIINGRRHSFSIKFEPFNNGSIVGSVVHEVKKKGDGDYEGALYYVIAVILIYGCSILMIIASYVRKNKMDQKLNRYIKEIATVRKREFRLKLANMAAAAEMRVREGNHENTVGKSSVSDQSPISVLDQKGLDCYQEWHRSLLHSLPGTLLKAEDSNENRKIVVSVASGESDNEFYNEESIDADHCYSPSSLCGDFTELESRSLKRVRLSLPSSVAVRNDDSPDETSMSLASVV